MTQACRVVLTNQRIRRVRKSQSLLDSESVQHGQSSRTLLVKKLDSTRNGRLSSYQLLQNLYCADIGWRIPWVSLHGSASPPLLCRSVWHSSSSIISRHVVDLSRVDICSILTKLMLVFSDHPSWNSLQTDLSHQTSRAIPRKILGSLSGALLPRDDAEYRHPTLLLGPLESFFLVPSKVTVPNKFVSSKRNTVTVVAPFRRHNYSAD